MAHVLATIEGIAAVVIAVYVAFVGTFQWITAREKVRLDLYNRRFEVFMRTVDFMQALMEWSVVDSKDRRAKRVAFITAQRESRFLFADDPRIVALLEEFSKESFVVTGFIEVLGPSEALRADGPRYVEFYNKKQASLEWIMAATGRLEDLLVPYLAFRHRAFRRWKWQFWKRQSEV